MSASGMASIRAFEAADQAALMLLYQQLNQEPECTDSALVACVIEEYLHNPVINCFVGFDSADKLVCSATLQVVPNLTRQCRPYGLIENVVTHSDYRRAGCGRTMLQYAIRYAQTAGCYKTMLMSNSRRTESHSFYRSCGFDQDAKQAFVMSHD